MSTKNDSSGGGVGLATILFIVFLILKLTGTIAWSWWWVTAPLWIGWLILPVMFLLVATIFDD